MAKYQLINEVVIKTGTEIVPLYIILGKTAMIIDGGILPDLETVSKTITAISAEMEISNWLITHAHYDHCGLLPYLRDSLPRCTVCGSPEAARSLEKQSVTDFIDARNQELNQEAWVPLGSKRQSQRRYRLDRIVEAGDEIDLGKEIRVTFAKAVGHSLCGLAVWLPGQRMLFPSDALGSCRTADDIMPLIFHSYSDYLNTNKQLAKLNPDWVLPGHYKHFSGSDATSLCDRAFQGISRFWNHYLLLEDRMSQEQALTTLGNHYFDPSASFIRPDIFRASIERMCQILKESV